MYWTNFTFKYIPYNGFSSISDAAKLFSRNCDFDFTKTAPMTTLLTKALIVKTKNTKQNNYFLVLTLIFI